MTIKTLSSRRISLKVITLLICLISVYSIQAQIKVACVGNSITEGWNGNPTYVPILQSLLGSGYNVQNDGKSGATILKKGDVPYWTKGPLSQVVAFKADIILLMLGTNDTKSKNWSPYSSEFKADYKALVETLQASNQNTKLYLVLPVPIWSNSYGIRNDILNLQIPIIKEVAAEKGLTIIDANTPFLTAKNNFPDGVHPNTTGANAIANLFYNSIKSSSSIPLINITSPANNISIAQNESATIQVTATTANGSITKVEFFNGSTKIGEDETAPYSLVWSNAISNTYTITAKATNSDGKSNSSQIIIKVTLPQSPYNGTPQPIPGIIQFEEYDFGGNGLAYYDSSPGSETGNTFRSPDDVDIEDCTDIDGGYNIGYGIAGEWLEYTVDVEAEGTYDIEIRVACNGDGRTVDLQIGDVVLNDIAIPNTGGWQTWETVMVNDVELFAGEQIMKIIIGDVSYVNLNHISYKSLITSLQSTKSSLQIYPNPTSDIINLPKPSNWKLYNINGILLASGQKDTTIDFSGYMSGIYSILINNVSHIIYKQ